MTTFPGSPRLIKGGLVLADPGTGRVQRVISLQYNPETLTRTLQAQDIGQASGGRSEALRLKGPPVETISLEAEIDAADQLEHPDQNQTTAELGIYPQLAALETLVYPSIKQLEENDNLARQGSLEIMPIEAPLALFVWSEKRVLPVRLTEFRVTEEAFDPKLNPLRAKVSLSMRVLNVHDLGFSHKGGRMFMSYYRQLVDLASKGQRDSLTMLGIRSIR
jgi:hypothetical protein